MNTVLIRLSHSLWDHSSQNEWCPPNSKWVFPPQLTHSKNSLTDMCSGLSPR